MIDAILLFAHGARDPEWARPVQRLAELVRSGAGAPRAEVAFLEFMSPSLEEAIAALVADGVERIAVVPVFLARGGHLKRDLPLLIEAARARHVGCRIDLTAAVGEDESVLQAMAAFSRRALEAH